MLPMTVAPLAWFGSAHHDQQYDRIYYCASLFFVFDKLLISTFRFRFFRRMILSNIKLFFVLVELFFVLVEYFGLWLGPAVLHLAVLEAYERFAS